jgi:transcription elongation GreA/GreB family factor
MSGAFVKGNDSPLQLLERPVSVNPNYVTREGLAKIQSEISRLETEYLSADQRDDELSLACITRDLRYWRSRQMTAEVVESSDKESTVRFGSTVTISHSVGDIQTFRIVGEDEADPRHGTLSYISPLARALVGKTIGESAFEGKSKVKIEKIG